MPTHDLSGQRVTVMGLGRFGGGVAVTRYLAALGADILVTDLAKPETLSDAISELQPLIDRTQVTLRLGEHNVSDFTTCDLVIANPAVPKPWDNRFLRAAAAASIPITTEIRLSIERIPTAATVVAVTGSAGKSTTAAMAAHALEKSWQRGRVVFAGNIGRSLLHEDLSPDDCIVLELSSAQLHWLGPNSLTGEPAPLVPDAAVFTTLSKNHIDWHGSFEHYRKSKHWLAAITREHGGAIMASEQAAEAFGFDSHTPPSDDLELALPGQHNRANASLAFAAASHVLSTCNQPAPGSSVLGDFAGLPHRLELVTDTQIAGGRFRAFNDSKCTTPDGVRLAVDAFDQPDEIGASRIWLIAGGYDKGTDPTPIAMAGARCARVFCIGDTGATIAASIQQQGGTAIVAETLDRAVAQAIAQIRDSNGPGVLLLSPGFASWDQFANYEKRGEVFAEAVKSVLYRGSLEDRSKTFQKIQK
ncbi:MAG: Mur ligase family protein [Phycisphaerales bacterium JB050]